MKVTITHISNVIEFLNIDFNTKEIDEYILKDVQETIDDLGIEKLSNWELEFVVSYLSGDDIKIFNRIPSDKKEKLKTVIIHIPVPLKEEIKWGVLSNQHMASRFQNKSLKNIEILDINYHRFNNRKDYITDCIAKGISHSLKIGFSINGIKVKSK